MALTSGSRAARPDGPRNDSMWAGAVRKLAILQAAQVLLLLVMAAGMVTVVVVLGNEIRGADNEAQRADAQVAEILAARDQIRRYEVDVWSNLATGESVYDLSEFPRFLALVGSIRALAAEQAGSDADLVTRAAREETLANLDALVVAARDAVARDTPPNAATGSDVLDPVNRAADDWVAASERVAADARARAEDLTTRLIQWLVAAIVLLAALGVGLWYVIGRLRGRVVSALRDAEGRFRSLIQDVVLVVDEDGTVTYASPSVERTLGYGDDELEGIALADLATQDDAIDIARLADPGTGGADLVTWLLRRADGSRVPVEVKVTDLRDDPMINGLVLNCRDITDRVDAEERLEHQAFHDPLTDLPNRTLFEDRLRLALRRSRRSGEDVAVIFLDLDDFKTVNDSLGHAAGDRLLVWASERIVSVIRDSDTAARLGGDEFAVVLEGPGGVEDVAPRVAEVLTEPLQIDGHDVAPQASVGIALARPDSTADALMRQADVAMYAAKAAGKGRRVVFRDDMEQAAHDRMALRSDLRHALDRGELSLRYQPIVDVVSGHTRFVEALLRWEHPERGPISPAEFIPLAEETGLIRSIGAWALESACKEAVRWRELRGSMAPALSVNLSARQLDDPQMEGLVARALAASGLDPDSLVLEVTESVLMSETDGSMPELSELAALGVRIAIDDFGVGATSLRYLGRLPIDIVKVDKSFVDAIADDERDAELAAAILRACDAFGLVCSIEGVERVEQARELERIGFHLAQGYYYSRPVGAEELRASLGVRLPVADGLVRV